MVDKKETKDYKFDFIYVDKCPTFVITKKAHMAPFEKDAIKNVFTGNKAILAYFKVLDKIQKGEIK